MLKFSFPFLYHGKEYEADCQPFPLDGTTELHTTPNDPALFHRFGVRILSQASDGTISTPLSSPADEQDYLMALAEGVASYFDDQGKTISQ